MSENILKESSAEAEKLQEVKKLTKENCAFYETPGGFITATVDGKEKGRVDIIRTFPLTDPDSLLSVRLPDKKMTELGMIENINDFADGTRQILLHQLSLRYYMPKILSIVNIKEEYGFTYWTVMTDKGKAKFASSSGSSGSVIPHGRGIIIKDSNENRYILEDLSKLSPKEHKKIDLYL